MQSVLVLGATGFIGGHIVLAALKQGWAVRGLRRRPGATGHVGPVPITWFDGDLDRPESLTQAFEGAEVVFHAAGYYPTSGRNVSAQVVYAVEQTRRVLDEARQAGVSRLVYTSSLTTIGRPPASEARLADERDHYIPGSLPRSAYYECKCAMESEVLRVAAEGFPAVVVNPTAVFGPGDLHMALGKLLLVVARGWAVAWLPAQINIVDVRDVAEAQIEAAKVGHVGERYILGGHNDTVRNLLVLAAEAAGVRRPRFEIPLRWVDMAVWLGDRFPALDRVGNHLRAVRHWQGYDCSKAKRELGLSPRPPEVTLNEALTWYQAHGYLPKANSVV
jgi:dihydroflavonol-4-reductase